jgi:lysophospholipase L1-like esterase
MAIQEEGALVVVGGIEVPFWGRGFGKQYKRLCNELGVVLVPNVLEDIFGNPALMSDRIHPNGAGYNLMAQRLYEVLKPYL